MGRFTPPFTPKTFPDAVNPVSVVKDQMSGAIPDSAEKAVFSATGYALPDTDYVCSNPLVNAWLVIENKGQMESYTNKPELDRIQLTYLEPGSFTVSKSANYASVQILGRSEPVRGYAHSSPRVVNLQISVPPMTIQPDFSSSDSSVSTAGLIKNLPKMSVFGSAISQYLRDNAQSRKQGGVSSQQRGQIFVDKKRILNFLQSLVYPHYNPSARIIQPPPPVLLIFHKFMRLRGIVTSVSFKHSPPYDPATATPYFTDVSLTIEESNRPWSFRDVYSGQADKIY